MKIQKSEVRSQKSDFLSSLICFLFSVFCLLSSDTEAAKPRLSTVVVEGTSSVTDGDLTLAKDIAIKNAKRSAVEDIVANFIKEIEGVEIYKESLEENIYNNYENFIQSYKILGDIQDKDTYSITIEVNIFEDSIKKRLLSLGIASIKHDNRKILLIIDEKTNISLAEDSFLFPFSISEDAISKMLRDAGFEVINRSFERNEITNVLTTDKAIGIAQSLRNAADKVAPVLVDLIKKELEG